MFVNIFVCSVKYLLFDSFKTSWLEKKKKKKKKKKILQKISECKINFNYHDCYSLIYFLINSI